MKVTRIHVWSSVVVLILAVLTVTYGIWTGPRQMEVSGATKVAIVDWSGEPIDTAHALQIDARITDVIQDGMLLDVSHCKALRIIGAAQMQTHVSATADTSEYTFDQALTVYCDGSK